MTKKTRSFTTIEIIMVIVILGIIASVSGIFVSEDVMSLTRRNAYTSALNLGRMEIEKVENLLYANIISLTTNNYLGYPFDVVRGVTYVFGNDTSAESLKQVTVEVRNNGSATDLIRLVTYIAKNISFGL